MRKRLPLRTRPMVRNGKQTGASPNRRAQSAVLGHGLCWGLVGAIAGSVFPVVRMQPGLKGCRVRLDRLESGRQERALAAGRRLPCRVS